MCTVPGCFLVFSRGCDLQRHTQSTHDNNNDDNNNDDVTPEASQAIACPHEGCGKSFKHKRNMLAHVRVSHDLRRGFTCDVAGCGASFAYKHVLQRHQQRVHMDPRPKRSKTEILWQALTGVDPRLMQPTYELEPLQLATVVPCEI